MPGRLILPRTVFWNVDTANDFMLENGKLYVPRAVEIIPALKLVTAKASAYNARQINQADLHDPDSPEISATPNWVSTFPAHCLRGTKGAEFIPETKPEDAYVLDWKDKSLDERLVLTHRNIVLTKDHVNVFDKERGSPHVERVLELLRPCAAMVYGVATNVCVDKVVTNLLDRGITMYVVQDATRALPGPDPIPGWLRREVKIVESKTLDQYIR